MTPRFAHTAALLALAAFSTCAPAQQLLQTDDPAPDQVASQAMETEAPGRVGRVSLVEGKVDISSDVGVESSAAQVNWPVTSRNTLSTAPGARAEIRIGSTSIRLDGDSALEVTELDDDRLRLRLHYGSASVRVVNADLLPGFELRTAQASVRLAEPGRLRVDADRTPDTSLVTMLDGVAQVDGGGASLTIRGGRSAEVREEDVRTLQARRDLFDDWSLTRDQQQAAQATRYVGTEMTGYEELDRHGSWSTDADYGALWTPAVAADWAPYRDGSWTWIAPWGWTWVDNAPWGYAPFHYGRWVQVRNRWAWAPGRVERRPVWSPALVGWVGGADWSTTFGGRTLPARGWYPLTPHDRFVPGYRLSGERLRRLNDWRQAGARPRERDHRRDGLTVVPQDYFGGRGQVVVPRAPRPALAPGAIRNTPAGAPPPPPQWRAARAGANDERRRQLLETRRNDADRVQAGERMQQEQQWRARADQERLARERGDAERLARERGEQQERVVRRQEELDRMQRDLDNRLQNDRTRIQFDRGDRERMQRDRMAREQMERARRESALDPAAPAPTFGGRPVRNDPSAPTFGGRPARNDLPPPRPAAPPTMVAPPAPRPQAAPAAPPHERAEQRAHTDARGVSRVER